MSKEVKPKKKKIGWILSAIFIPLIFCCGFTIFAFSNIKPFTMDGISMQPNLCENTFIIAIKSDEYKVGDVIVYKHDQISDYAKRIIGMGGDRIKIEGGKVYKNDQLLEETYIPVGRKTKPMGDNLKDGQTYIVPQGQLFVMGDNRDNSLDSRSFLAINPYGANKIKGKVYFIKSNSQGFRKFDKTKAFDVTACNQ